MHEDQKLDAITRKIIGAAINVHRALGPGLLESTYETCLAFELQQLGMKIERQRPLPIRYRGITLDCGYRLDLVVEDCVIVELKATEGLLPVHQAQLLSYLRLTGLRVGLLITFNVPVLRRGLKRIVNDFPDAARSASAGAGSSSR